jgi:phosphohistidine phosphatase SixA
MRHSLLIIVLLFGLTTLIPASGSAETKEIVDRLKAGGHILMIRHALAPGNGDPPGFKIGDCTTQRNLDDSGRNQARRIGDWLRAHGVSSARIYSSQWCRCLETAKLLDLGPVKELAALNSFYERPQDRESNLKALNEFISHQPADGGLIILVTHFVTISAVSGEGVSSGGGVLLTLHKGAPYAVAGRIGFEP